MKTLAVLSGKGGTGKTTVANALIRLAGAKAYADCDVETPNLHLLSGAPPLREVFDYHGMDKAFIDDSLCTRCGLCEKHCRFHAVKREKRVYLIDSAACEGCGVCEYVCPADAITMRPSKDGEVCLHQNKDTFVTARLRPGAATSGLLVTDVKARLETRTKEPMAILDGPAGIGCPVIATLARVAMALLVAEPSVSGIGDLKRMAATAQGFGIPLAIIVNKHDMNASRTREIRRYANEEGLFFAGMIPYDKRVVEALDKGGSILDVPGKTSRAVRKVGGTVLREFDKETKMDESTTKKHGPQRKEG